MSRNTICEKFHFSPLGRIQVQSDNGLKTIQWRNEGTFSSIGRSNAIIIWFSTTPGNGWHYISHVKKNQNLHSQEAGCAARIEKGVNDRSKWWASENCKTNNKLNLCFCFHLLTYVTYIMYLWKDIIWIVFVTFSNCILLNCVRSCPIMFPEWYYKVKSFTPGVRPKQEHSWALQSWWNNDCSTETWILV